MRPARRARWPIRAVAGLLLATASSPATAQPLTDEDVVRLFVAGSPTEAIIDEIERREPQFDLSPEMLVELRRTGLPEEVIRTMVRRQDALRQPAPPVAEEPAGATHPMLHILLNPGRSADEPTWLTIRTRVDPQLASEWELGNAPEDRLFAGMALYLACRTPDHVPDHWRSKSPLGRDFFRTPRHRILTFEASAGGE